MELTQSKPISTDPKIINKPVWHIWTVKTSFLQVNSMQTSVKAGRPRLAISLTNFPVEIGYRCIWYVSPSRIFTKRDVIIKFSTACVLLLITAPKTKGPCQVSFSSLLNSVNNSHVLCSAKEILMTQAYLHAACVELAELLTAMLMKKTSCRHFCTHDILRPKKLLK